MDKPLNEGLDFVKNAFEKEAEERLFQRWIHGYHQTISFDDFKKEMTKNASVGMTKTKNQEEILEDVASILEMRR